VLNRQGEPARKIIGSVGFIAATLPEQGMPTWLVSGTDSESLEAAAQHLTKQALQHRYAVAWAGKDEISAPLGSGG
jgi:microcystin degradation protein MlrC